MYGTQDASTLWKYDCTHVLGNAMDQEGSATPVLFRDEFEDSIILLHGGDFSAMRDECS